MYDRSMVLAEAPVTPPVVEAPHAPAPYVEPKLPGEAPEQAAPGEDARLHKDFKQLIQIDGTANGNRALVDRGYAKKETVTAEFKAAGKNVGDAAVQQEIDTEVQRRETEQQDARKPKKEDASEEMIAAEAKKMAAEDGPWKGKDANDPALREEAALRAAQKRIDGLTGAYDILYTAQDAVASYNAAVESAIQGEGNRLIQEEIAKRNAQAHLKTPPDPDITDLPDGEKEQIRAGINRSEVGKRVKREDYYDPDNRKYHKVGADGKPTADVVSYDDAYEAMYEELIRVSGLPPAADGTPNPDAERAQQLLKSLHYNRDENAFQVYTPEQKMLKEREAGQELLIQTAENVFNSICDQGVPPAKEASSLVSSLGLFLDRLKTTNPPLNPLQRNMVLAAINERLMGLANAQTAVIVSAEDARMLDMLKKKPGAIRQLNAFKNNQALKDMMEEIHDSIKKGYVDIIMGTTQHDVNMEHFFQSVSLAALCREQGLTKPAEVKRILAKFKIALTAGDQQLITFLAGEDTGGIRTKLPGGKKENTNLDQMLDLIGMNAKDIGDFPKYIAANAKRIVENAAMPGETSQANWAEVAKNREAALRGHAVIAEKFVKDPKFKLDAGKILMLIMGGGTVMGLVQPILETNPEEKQQT
ncbi:MAG: hypothetical protein M1366_00145 [Patescibacteria group bacterium]|nr:hypothetical protein [Patescibacteria group bacterium]